jgi:alpha-ribazole phosphatase
MSANILWLIRHPEPEPSARGHCYGSLDVALSPDGVRQAHAIADSLRNEPLTAIYSSPRQRCTDTARILAAARSCAVETIDALRELDFGAFEGRSYDEIAALFPDPYRQWMERPTETHFPQGESFCQMSARVLGALRELQTRHCGDSIDSIALITHGGPIRVILADALGMPPANIFRIAQRYGAINRIRYSGEIPTIEMLNSSSTHGTGEVGEL